MKFTVFFTIISILLTLDNIRKGFGEEIKAVSLKRGDVVGIKLSMSTIKYGWVEKDGESPFQESKIVTVYKITDKDYQANVDCIFEGRIPEWIYLQGLLQQGVYRVPKNIGAECLKKGDIVGVKLSEDTVKYELVETEGVSPFQEQRIIKVYKNIDDDYLSNVEKYIGEIVPAWLIPQALYERRIREARNLRFS